MKKLATRLTIVALSILVFANHGSTIAREPAPTAAASFAASLGVPSVAHPELGEALADAAHRAATVIVTGSFHTVGDAMHCLQLDPLAG